MSTVTSSTTSALLGRRKPENVLQLTEQLRIAINTGVLKQGDQLPTIRQLSEETGLASNVISRTFSILQAEGLLISRKRAGTFVKTQPQNNGDHAPQTAVKVFALIAPELSTGYYPLLQKGFDLAAGQHGYQIIASHTDNDVRAQADSILQLMDKRVAGIALVPATLGPPPTHHIRQLQRNNIPVVMLHRSVEGVTAPQLRIPAEKIGKLAGQQLIDAGHTRIAYCASQHAGAAIGYERGLTEVLSQAGLDLPEHRKLYGDIVLINDKQLSIYEKQFEAWFNEQMNRQDRPTAIFTSFETIGEIAYLTAINHSLKVPEDLSIITVGGNARHGAVTRRLASITLDETNAGMLTAKLLSEMNQGTRPIDDAEVFAIDIDFDPGQTIAKPCQA